MKYLKIVVFLSGILWFTNAFSQTLSLSGKINTSNELVVSTATAGANPLNLNLFNTASGNLSNTSQSLSYKWPYRPLQSDDPEARILGNITVKTDIAYDQIPTCFEWKIEAAVSSSLLGNYGASTGEITLSPTKTTIVRGVWSTYSWVWLGTNSNRTANLTQSLSLSSFADLYPTTNSDYITVRVSYEFY